MSGDADFGWRLDAAFAKFGHLCVGIDPHPYLFARWGYDDTPRSLEEFSKRVLDACVDRVGIVKPQVAFLNDGVLLDIAPSKNLFVALVRLTFWSSPTPSEGILGRQCRPTRNRG